MTSGDTAPEEAERPPFLGSWRKVYVAVLGFLAVQVVAMYAFRMAFS